jgi:hypothetical protein
MGELPVEEREAYLGARAKIAYAASRPLDEFGELIWQAALVAREDAPAKTHEYEMPVWGGRLLEMFGEHILGGRTEREHEPAGDDGPITIREALEEMNRWHERARRAERHAEVLAKALDQFLRKCEEGGVLHGWKSLAIEVEPTLQAIQGYPKAEGS